MHPSYKAYFKALCVELFDHADEPAKGVFDVCDQAAAVGAFRTGASTNGWLFRLVISNWSLTPFSLTSHTAGFILAKRTAVRDVDAFDTDTLHEVDTKALAIAYRMIADCQAGHAVWHHSIRDEQSLNFKALNRTQFADGYIGRLYTYNYIEPYVANPTPPQRTNA